jgi:KDO2-lipid IV(A) lauroyltransferase
MGNWELLAAYGARRGLNVLAVARRAKSAIAQAELERLRASNGYRIAWKDDKQTPRQLIKHFSEGGLVAALLDQDMAGRGTFSPFFGYPVKSNVSLIELAQRRDVHIASAFCIRRPDGTFFIEVESMSADLSAEAVFQLYHERLESIIHRYPEQWVWVHKRWRSMPDGSQLGRRDYLTYLQTLLREGSTHPSGLQS